MSNFCTLCKSDTSTPFNFLLPCVKCHSFWHHRCHKPPVSDKDLIDIIKLYNLHKQSGDKKPSFIWTCGACTAQPNPPPAVPPSRSSSAPSTAHPSSRQQSIIVLDSDDDSDVVIVSKSTKTHAVKSHKTVTSAKSATKSANVVPPPQSARLNAKITNSANANPQSASKRLQAPKAPSTASSAVPHPQTIETRRDTGIRIIEDPFIEFLSPPTSPPRRPPLKTHSSATSSTSANLSAELGGLHMSNDDDAHMSTRPPSHRSQEPENEWDLEYLTPPAPRPVQLPSVDDSMPPPPLPVHALSSRSQGHVRIAQSLPPIAAWVSHDDEENEDEERNEEEDEDELEVDEIDATPAPIHTVINQPQATLVPAWINQRIKTPPPNEPRKPFSRKKVRAQNKTAHINNNSISASRRSRPSHLEPFFFSTEQWVQKKRRTLPQYPTGLV